MEMILEKLRKQQIVVNKMMDSKAAEHRVEMAELRGRSAELSTSIGMLQVAIDEKKAKEQTMGDIHVHIDPKRK